jgi:hypothetical protein
METGRDNRREAPRTPALGMIENPLFWMMVSSQSNCRSDPLRQTLG